MSPGSSSAWVRGLLDMFAAQGVDGQRLLSAAAIHPARLADPHERFDVDEVSRLWELAIAASGNELLGMDRELAARHIDFDDVAYAMIACPDLRAGLLEFTRYLDLLSSATSCRVQEMEQGAWVSMVHVGTRRAVPWQRAAYSLLALLAMCRWLLRADIRPLAVEMRFRCPSPAADAACQRAFGVQLTYGAQEHRMLIQGQDLARPVPSQDAALLVLHERVIEERLLRGSSSRLSTRVADIIAPLLMRGIPKREEVAGRLGLSDRSFQRRLQQENTSFQQILDATQRDLARVLLADQRRPVGQVAHMLGFSDESTFCRACRRWYGTAPGQLRKRQHD